MASSQKKKLQLLNDAPLMTRGDGIYLLLAMREREKDAKRSKYPKTLVRVRFPNRMILQATFLSNETVSCLYDVVRKVISNETDFM